MKPLVANLGGFDIAVELAIGRSVMEGTERVPLSQQMQKVDWEEAARIQNQFPADLVGPLIYNLRGFDTAIAIARGEKLVEVPGRIIKNGPALDPATHLGNPDVELIVKESDLQAAALTVTNYGKVNWTHAVTLEDRGSVEGFPNGHQKHARLKTPDRILLGTRQMTGLYFGEKGHQTLWWLWNMGIREIDFFGDLLWIAWKKKRAVATLTSDKRANWKPGVRELDLPYGENRMAGYLQM